MARTAYQDCGGALIRSRAEQLWLPELAVLANLCLRFACTETEDQLNAINDVADDLAAGKPVTA